MIFDHVGWLVRDLDAGQALVTTALGAGVDRTVDRPQWSLYGYYVGALEVFTFTDPQLLDERLGKGVDARLDHVAYAVDDIRAELAHLKAEGAELVDEEPREGLFGHEIAFVHHESVLGVLSELVASG
jgi:methylmalonyl-CoA/ethylmalonyl-CoA epimerase